MTRSTVKKLAVVALIVVTLLTLEAFLVPWIVRDQLGKRSAEAGVDAKVERVAFNPFVWRLEMEGFDAAMANGPPLLSFERAEVDFGFWSSLFHLAPALDALVLAGPRITLHLDETELHWMALVPGDTVSEPEAAEPADPLNIYLSRIEISNGRVDYREPAHPTNYQTALDDLDFVLTDLDTSIDEPGAIRFDIEPEGGGEIRLTSELVANPFQWSGTLELIEVQLAPHWRYVEYSQPIDISGTLNATVPWQLALTGSSVELRVAAARLAVNGLSATWLDGGDELVGLESLVVGPAGFDLSEGILDLGQVELSGLVGRVKRADRDRLARLQSSEPTPDVATPSSATPLVLRVPTITMTDSRIEVSDQSLQPAFRATLGIDKASLTGFDSGNPQPLPISLSGSVNEASLGVEGAVAWAQAAVEADIDLDGFKLADVDSIVRSIAPLSVTGGTLATKASLDTGRGQARGRASISGLQADWLDPQHGVLSDADIDIQEVVADLDRPGVKVGRLVLSNADVLVRRFEDGSTILSRLAMSSGGAEETPPEDSSPGDYPFEVAEIQLDGQTVRFEDLAIDPGYRTVLSDLSGTVTGIGSKTAELELSAQIDGQAPLEITGGSGPEEVRIDISASNIELTPISPYSGKFVGYRIGRGKLKTELGYELAGTTLRGTNDLVLDDFELGEAVPSEDAVQVPLKLGLALLRDLDGTIRLDVPVSGDVSDPSFSVGGVILKAFANLFVKLAASPFRILGALVPGGGEDLQIVHFDAASEAPAGDEVDALNKLAEALKQRPALRLDVPGVAIREIDVPAIQRQRLREQLAAVDDADYRRKVTETWLARFPVSAREPVVDDAAEPPGEPALPEFDVMERALLEAIEVDEETLRALADSRAQNIVAVVTAREGLSERVFRLAPIVRSDPSAETVAIELAVDAR